MPTANFFKIVNGTSYRLRTAIFLFFVVIFIGLAIGATLRIGTRVALENEIDLLLIEDAEELSQVLQAHGYDVNPVLEAEWNRRAAVHELHHWFIRVVLSDDTVLWESIGIPTEPPPLQKAITQQPITWQNYRIVERKISSANMSPEVYLQIGTGLDTFIRDLWLLDRLLAITLLSLCLLGPLSAWYLAGRLLHPLADLTLAAEKLELASQGSLLPLRGTRDELDRLAETINHLILRVRRELQQREDWLANSAHQLRSPLAAISSNVEVVANRTQSETSRAMLESVLEECTALRSLVNKLLLLSETDADRLKPKDQRASMTQIVQQAAEIYEGLAQSHNIDLRLIECDDVTVEGNAYYLRHVVQNLIDNAIKYSHPGGQVKIGLQLRSSEGLCRLRIEDQGIGIDPKDMKKVTERFFRANTGRNPASTPRGSGLGLSICQSIIQGHQGTLVIESKIGMGTVVTVDLPIPSSSNSPT